MIISLELPDRIDEAKARELVAQVEKALRDWPDGRLMIGVVVFDPIRAADVALVGGIDLNGAHWKAVAGAALDEAVTALHGRPGVSGLRLRIQNARLALGMDEPDPGAAA